MKQIRTILTAACLLMFLSVPMTAWAAPEPEHAMWTESMEGRTADADAREETGSAVYGEAAEAEQEAGQKQAAETGRKAEQKQETEESREAGQKQEGTKPQSTGGNSGTLRVQNAAAGTGEWLSGAVFTIHEKDGTKTGELTLREGTASISLPAGDYYLKQQKAPAGYGVEPARIAFTVSKGETTLAEVTSEIDLLNVNPQDIIPKTGETAPFQAYALSVLCFAAAFLCGYKLRRMDGGNRGKGGVCSWQS